MMKAIRNRYAWLINKVNTHNYINVAEIGCKEGNTSMHLLKHCPQINLVCVDLWDYVPGTFTTAYDSEYIKWNFKEIKATFDKQVQPWKDRVVILQGVSWEMAERVEDGTLDFIFIDADHGYKAVKKDIQAWIPKVCEGGMITGHDITAVGVQAAVSELIKDHRRGPAKMWWTYKK